MTDNLLRLAWRFIVGGLAGLGTAAVVITALACDHSPAFQPSGPIDFPALLRGELAYVAAAGFAVAVVMHLIGGRRGRR